MLVLKFVCFKGFIVVQVIGVNWIDNWATSTNFQFFTIYLEVRISTDSVSSDKEVDSLVYTERYLPVSVRSK